MATWKKLVLSSEIAQSVSTQSLDVSGSVGIGRTPTQKLDIYASSGNQTIMNELGGAGNAELRLKNNAGDRIIRASSDKLQFIDNADSRADLSIDGSGNSTFAGDITTNERLIFGGTNDSIVASAITPHSNGFIYITGGSSGLVIGDDATSSRIQIMNDAEIRFEVNGSERMRLDTNSRVSLSNNDSGTGNTIFGYKAGNAITTGHNNVVMGNNALLNSQDIGFAVAIGNSVMSSGTMTNGADGTIAIGQSSLTNLTSGGKNIAIGYQAGLESTIEDFNTYIGYQSGYRTAGLDNQHNTFIGYGSGSGDWTSIKSDKNTGVGSLTLAGAMNSGIQNTALGFAALNIVTTGDSNVGVGVTAGNTLTSGSNNTIIGTDADVNSSSATNRISIGQGTIATEDNSIFIGNSSTHTLYIGKGRTTTQNIRFNDAGEAGIIQYDHSNQMFRLTVEQTEHSRFENDGDLVLLHGGINTAGSVTIASGGSTDNLYLANTSYGMRITNSTGVIDFISNGSTRMSIANGGGVTFTGNTTSNGNILAQGSAAPSISVLDTTNNASLQMRALDTEVRFGSTSNHPVKIGTNNTYDALILGTDKSATFGGDITGASGLTINWLNSNTRITGSNSSGFLQFDVGGTGEVLKLTSSSSTFAGSVMINSSSANYADLTVGGTGDIVALRASSGTAGFTMYEGGTGRFNMTTLNGSGGIAFKVPTTTALTLDSSGDAIFANTAIFPNNKSINFLNTSGVEKAIISFNNSNVTKIGDSSNSGTLQLSGGNATFAGSINTQDITAYNMITIESADISNGENNGLRLINTSGTDHYWHITNGQTGVSNENFTIRDGTNNRDVLVLTSAGNATFSGNLGINTDSGGWGLNVKGADANVFKVLASDGNTLSYLQGTNGDATQRWFADGNATKVLINTNGDSYFTGGNVGIGVASPDYQLELEKAGGGFLSFKTTDTEIQNNDVLGTIQFGANDATTSGIDIGAKIVATATDNFQSAGSNVDAPTKLEFFTQDNTTTDVMSTVGATLTLGGDDQNAKFVGQEVRIQKDDGRFIIQRTSTSHQAEMWMVGNQAYFGSTNGTTVNIRTNNQNALIINTAQQATFTSNVTTGGTLNVVGASGATATLNINANNGASANNKVRFLKEIGAEFKLQMNTGGVSSFANLVNFTGTGTTFHNDVTLTTSTSSSPFLIIQNTNEDDNMGGLKFIKDSVSPGTGDKLMQIWAYGDNDYAEQILYSEIATLPTSVADGSEEGSMRFRVMNAGSFVETMRIRGNKVGIGTTSPAVQFHLKSSTANNFRIERSGTTNAAIHFKNASEDWYAGITSAENFSISRNADIASGAEFVIRGNTGRVGIGTSNPDTNLHIYKASAGSVTTNTNSQFTIENNSHASMQFLSPNNANSIIYFGDVDDNDVGYINYVHSSNTMNFQTNTAVRLSIEDSGNVNIGSSSKTNNVGSSARGLTIGNATAPVLSLWDTTNAGYHSHFFQVENNAFLRSSGNLTIQTNAGTTALTVDSNQITNITPSSNTGVSFDNASNNIEQYFRANSVDSIAKIKVSESAGGGVIGLWSKNTSGTQVERLNIDTSGNSTFAGDITVSKSGNAFLNLTSTGGGARIKLTGQANETTNGLLFYENSNIRAQVNYNHSTDKMEFKTHNSGNIGATLALTIDGDQNATFEGNIEGVYIETFSHNFTDDLGTSNIYIPWQGTGENTSMDVATTAFLTPFAMELVSFRIRPETISNSGTINVQFYKQANGSTTRTDIGMANTGTLSTNNVSVLLASAFDILPTVSANEKVGFKFLPSTDLGGEIDWYVTTVWKVTKLI